MRIRGRNDNLIINVSSRCDNLMSTGKFAAPPTGVLKRPSSRPQRSRKTKHGGGEGLDATATAATSEIVEEETGPDA